MTNSLELKRDCDAVQIPSGNPVILPAGTVVEITQDLGGTYTVSAEGGLFHISSKNADALGMTPPAEKKDTNPQAVVEEKAVWDILKNCYDPEIPINIVDLGLIYDLRIEQIPGSKSRVLVKMTLTAPGCGMGTIIASDAQQRILQLPGVAEATVEVVWDPPWHQSMITAEGRRILGLE